MIIISTTNLLNQYVCLCKSIHLSRQHKLKMKQKRKTDQTELLLKLLICIIYAELFKAVYFKSFEPIQKEKHKNR